MQLESLAERNDGLVSSWLDLRCVSTESNLNFGSTGAGLVSMSMGVNLLNLSMRWFWILGLQCWACSLCHGGQPEAWVQWSQPDARVVL